MSKAAEYFLETLTYLFLRSISIQNPADSQQDSGKK